MTNDPENWEAEGADAPAETTEPAAGNQIPADDAAGKQQLVPTKKAALVVNERGYIAPKTVEEAARMAQAVIVGGLAPDSYKSKESDWKPDPSKVLLGIMSALEAGLPPLYGLRQIAIINGRPTIWGDGAVALVQSKNLIASMETEWIGTKPDTADLSKWPDDYGCRVTIKRRHQDGEYVGEFTVAKARAAKLWLNAKKVPWLEHPERMLFNRARAWALRDGFADALGGIAIREEIEDMMDADKADKHIAIDLSDAPKVEAPPLPDEDEVEEEK